jgi:FixJ family two-component response regulator
VLGPKPSTLRSRMRTPGVGRTCSDTSDLRRNHAGERCSAYTASMKEEPRVFVIDDDPIVLRALERFLRAHGFLVEAYASAAAFFDRPVYEGVACMVLDLRMPDLSGLELQDFMTRKGISMPIVFLSGQSDVASTARAMREGAVDFLVKPVDESQLLDAVERARARAIDMERQRGSEREAEERLGRLTKREREVCDLVARGLLNKQIASELGTSEKTVKVHRGRMMRKLEVSSVAALVRLLSHTPPR